MRDKTDPEVAAYLEAENAYAAAVMKPTEPFQTALYQEILGRIQATDLSVPYREGGYFYYSRTEEGKQYPILCRKKKSREAPEEVTLDLDALAEGHKFFSLGAYVVSDDGSLLAYSTDLTGRAQGLPRMRVANLRSGAIHHIAFPEPAYSAFPGANAEFDTQIFRYTY